MGDINKEYEASLKSIETENKVDRVFYRPIGFRIARLLKDTGITPNVITIISIFVGGVVGYFFYVNNIVYTIIGILLLVFANILDCVDGQLARMTGIKSAIGRILDGMAGDIWFTSIYIGFALRLMNIYDTAWFFGLAVLSGLSHLIQANITDYYKTLHLFFISKEKGSEFQSLQQVKEKHKAMKPGINKTFYLLYIGYTYLQVKATPCLQKMLAQLSAQFGDDIPDNIRQNFRSRSLALMPYIDLLTFNGRTIVMFIIVLTGHVWIYFLYEIIVLNLVLIFVMNRHEKMCAAFLK
ncbi:CDP-alcohol phosphatidyltransferase family protein [Massilibacteroides sp.]|uniref:CDP-alcohol phosphatidyltransferase family protein n=1 Tax=Massilibacteroides sp. TaxID=2034766 RepID=UPI00262A4BAC|nr:CDP-alcohol phosphatidyltransferase family protein [Massilibacteroides sp.]MDD4514144.1 CDP-alcohol phosphatidyltransferase family protein [Massilibacteroides sp.]